MLIPYFNNGMGNILGVQWSIVELEQKRKVGDQAHVSFSLIHVYIFLSGREPTRRARRIGGREGREEEIFSRVARERLQE